MRLQLLPKAPSRRLAPLTTALLLASLCSSAAAQTAAPHTQPALSLSALRQGFAAPPAPARLRCYWWWLNGHTDKATITHDLEQMKAKGFGGALLVDANGSNQEGNRNAAQGPEFGSPAWVELYTHALKEADRLGLEITLNITSGWNLGGPDVRPEDASKILTWTRTTVAGGRSVREQLSQPETRNGFYRQIAVLAYPLHHGEALPPQPAGPPLRARAAAVEAGFSMPDATPMLRPQADAPVDASLREVRNISASVQPDGSLAWDAPAGQWEILRIGYTDSGARVSTSSGAWQGLAIDYLNRSAFQTYWDHTVEPLLRAAQPYHSLKYLATDSWELGGTNWTSGFAKEFQTRRGYDPTPWLAVVAGRIIQSPDDSTRFLTDLRRTVADLVSANHYDVFAALAARHGLGMQAESGGPHGAPIDALETFRHSAVPQSEFWSINRHRARDLDRFFTKEAASAANIYGQRFVAQEGETSVGPQWSESLATDLKPSFDMAITEGMNRLVWHEFTSSPAETGLPGQEYFAGTHLNPKITWWNAGPAFFTYLNRAQFLMQQGTAVDDVLYFTGDNIPSFVRLKGDDPAKALPGYDYDATDEDALLHTIRLTGPTLTGPSGVTWRALALPASGRISLASLRRIEAYVQGGGVVIGHKPDSPTGLTTPADRAVFEAIATHLWGDDCAEGTHHSYARGAVYCTASAHTALQQMGVPADVEPVNSTLTLGATSTSAFDYAHRRTPAADIYFLRNGSAQPISTDVTFRATSATPQQWDAVTGAITTATAQPIDGGKRTQLHIELPPFGSTFVLFPHTAAPHADAPFTATSEQPLIPEGPWTLAFQPNRGAPSHPITLSKLESWTESSDPGVRYFSGTATYTASVTAPQHQPTQRVYLRFNGVREIARVRINGHDGGTVWAAPYTLRVDPFLRPGPNQLEIEVTNLWPNRIIGDLQPGAPTPITHTNITAYRADSPLLPSGLLAPPTWLIGN